jgi:hypothetical protein
MFQTTVEVDGEHAMDMSIARSLRPSCNLESTISKKRSRLESWSTSPDLADKEVKVWQQKMNEAKDSFAHLDGEIEQWHEAFQKSRKILLDLQLSCTDGNNNLRIEASQLLALCESEVSLERNKKRVFQLRDAADELVNRQTARLDRAKEIELLVQESNLVKGSNARVLPTVFLSINEADHPLEFSILNEKSTSLVSKSTVSQDTNESKVVAMEVDEIVSSDNVADSASNIGSDTRNITNLLAVLNTLQESVHSGESGLRELDAFFAPERDDEDLAAVEAVISGVKNTGLPTLLALDVPLTSAQQKLAEGTISLDGRIDLWEQHVVRVLDSLVGTQHGATTRKKKKGAEAAIPLRAGVRSHSEYGACLLLSPLSQYPDRVLGSVQSVDSLFVRSGGASDDSAATFTQAANLPRELVQAENDAMERCRLQSCAAAGELKLTQLRQASLDLRRTAADSSNALKRGEYVYLQTLHEDASERRRIRKELVFYGIAPVHASDPPMSPLHHAQSSASQFSGVGVSKNAFRTSAANKSRSAGGRASGAAAASALSRGNARYMNNGFSATSTHPSSSAFDTSSPARGNGRTGNGLAAPAAPTRSSRYSNSANASVTPVVPVVAAPILSTDSRRRSNGRSIVAQAPEIEAPRAEESAAAKRRARR